MATGVGLSAYSTRTEAIPTASLDSLADDVNAIGTTQIVNTSALRYDRIVMDIYLASVDLSSVDNPALYIWLLELLDGSNYEDGGASVDPARQPDIIIPLREVSGAQRARGQCLIEPGTYLALLGNRAGAALASSGNTIYYRKFSGEINN